jgi:hypothetical protein
MKNERDLKHVDNLILLRDLNETNISYLTKGSGEKDYKEYYH